MDELSPTKINRWKTLDKDLGRIALLEDASAMIARPTVAVGVAVIFILVCGLAAAGLVGASPGTITIVIAAAFGAYMALNIGANDVANNMGPAVGANALTMSGALVIAAIFETAGSMIAGGDVVSTISSGIVAPSAVADPTIFVRAMMAALIASSVWLNLATWLGAPVSTTHAIVGGVMGAGVAAAGFAAVQWGTLGQIAASWVISPVMGGLIAAILLAFINRYVKDAPDRLDAARRWVPALIGLIGGYLRRLSRPEGPEAGGRYLHDAIAAARSHHRPDHLGNLRPIIRRQSEAMANRKRDLKKLFSLPLIASAALLSFAHGANDVANAVGPLRRDRSCGALRRCERSGRNPDMGDGHRRARHLLRSAAVRAAADPPGRAVTKLNQMRAYCVALSAAVTVIAASRPRPAGLLDPHRLWDVSGSASSREWEEERRARVLNLKKGKPVAPEERKRRKLVRRVHVLGIGATWVVTVPLTALLSALIFWSIGLVS